MTIFSVNGVLCIVFFVVFVLIRLLGTAGGRDAVLGEIFFPVVLSVEGVFVFIVISVFFCFV